MKEIINIFKGLNKYYNKKDELENAIIEKKDYIGYIDNCHCNMFIPKTTFFKKILNDFYELKISKIPEISYKNMEIDTLYSTDFLKILHLINNNYSHVIIKAGSNMPLQIETEDYIFISAPCFK